VILIVRVLSAEIVIGFKMHIFYFLSTRTYSASCCSCCVHSRCLC